MVIAGPPTGLATSAESSARHASRDPSPRAHQRERTTLNTSGSSTTHRTRRASSSTRHPLHGAPLKLIAVTTLIENFLHSGVSNLGARLRNQRASTGVVYCSISGYGHTGRDKHFTTWGPTAQALSGLTIMSGLPGKPPAGWGYSYMDHTAGYYGAIAIMMALHHRNRTGQGQYIDVSQVETGMALTGPAVLDATVNGRSWRRPGMPPGNRAWEPAVAPHNTYPCAGEDRWIAIAVRNDAEWQAMARAMGEPAWATEAGFATNAGRVEHQDELDAHIAAWTSAREDYAVMQVLQAAGVPAGVLPEHR